MKVKRKMLQLETNRGGIMNLILKQETYLLYQSLLVIWIIRTKTTNKWTCTALVPKTIKIVIWKKYRKKIWVILLSNSQIKFFNFLSKEEQGVTLQKVTKMVIKLNILIKGNHHHLLVIPQKKVREPDL